MGKQPTSIPDYAGTRSDDGDSVFISAPAKINLFLKVLRKRSDGYHDIYSWFQAIDLCDHLQIERLPDRRIEIETEADNIPTGPENLVYRAARLLQERLGIESGFKTTLRKAIPVGAGLGGGSSDAAAFIKGADKLLNLGLSRAAMADVGLALGSDVPFFFSRGQALVTGRGEIVEPIELPTAYQVALVTPPFEIRAAEAYRKLRLDLTAPFTDIKFKSCRQARDFFNVVSGVGNDLEKTLRESYPILDKIGENLSKLGADIVRLSGSGPTVFALFEDRTITKKRLRHIFKGEGWGLNVAGPVVLPA